MSASRGYPRGVLSFRVFQWAFGDALTEILKQMARRFFFVRDRVVFYILRIREMWHYGE